MPRSHLYAGRRAAVRRASDRRHRASARRTGHSEAPERRGEDRARRGRRSGAGDGDRGPTALRGADRGEAARARRRSTVGDGEAAVALARRSRGIAREPESWSCGMPTLFRAIARSRALGRAFRLRGVDAAFAGTGRMRSICSAATRATRLGSAARLFAPSFGITEDPATGPAAAALAGWLSTRSRRRRHAPLGDPSRA